MEFNLEKFIGIQKNTGKARKSFCYQKLFWPFTVWINFSSDLKIFANSRSLALNFKCFSQSLEQFFLIVSQNNFGKKIQFFLVAFFAMYAIVKVHLNKVLRWMLFMKYRIWDLGFVQPVGLFRVHESLVAFITILSI